MRSIQNNSPYLVETIPADLGWQPEHNTAATLLRLINQSKKTIDVSTIYWSLLPESQPKEVKGLSAARLKELGVKHGRFLYDALENALQRGVHFRVLQSSDFESNSTDEIERLAARYTNQIAITFVSPRAWYDGGIMHQKVWVFDGRSFYIGSANMDWRSLAQVKELGVVVENDPIAAAQLTAQLEIWHQFAKMAVTAVSVPDPISQTPCRVPAWSHLAPDPLPNPFPIIQQLDEPIITTSPPELCENGRFADGDIILQTINEAKEQIDIEVMSFSSTTHAQKWQPVIADALLRAVFERDVHVRLLVSRWAHTYPPTVPYLHALQAIADGFFVNDDKPPDTDRRHGSLELRQFIILGWDCTQGENRLYPDHSRVNHAKFIVTEQRVNIGTSNFSWDYFTQTGGCSFNSKNGRLISQLQAIFERDWQSCKKTKVRGNKDNK